MPPRLALYVAALLAAWVMGPHGPIYWDSFGYVGQAITGRVGGLALGRPVFVLVSHAIAGAFRALGGSVWSLEPLLRTFWLAISAFAAPLTYTLARACGLAPRGALIAGMAVALSPALGHTSDAVLTDGPSLAAALLAFVLAARAVGVSEATPDARGEATPSSERGVAHPIAWALAAGATLGLAFGLREQAVAQLVVLALIVPLAPRARRVGYVLGVLAAFAVVSVAPVAYVWVTQPVYPRLIAGWVRGMQHERVVNHYGVRDFLYYLAWLVALGPVALLAGAMAWVRGWRELARRWSLSLAVCVPALVQLALLGAYQDISYSPRYLLVALPGALAIPAGLWLDRVIDDAGWKPWVLGALLVIPVAVAGPVVRHKEQPMHDAVRALPAMLANVPRNAVLVTGQVCPATELVARLARTEPAHWHAATPDWQRVCPGWGWPDSLVARLDRARAEGRPLVFDLRAASWLGPGQRAKLGEIVAYLGAHRDEERRGEIIVWR